MIIDSPESFAKFKALLDGTYWIGRDVHYAICGEEDTGLVLSLTKPDILTIRSHSKMSGLPGREGKLREVVCRALFVSEMH
jgi:hypothetical protein